MFFWPFKRKPPETLSPAQLRDKLIAAAGGSASKLRSVCNDYKEQVAANVDFMCKVPDGMPTDTATIDRYIQHLGAVATCLANECGAPELWNRLRGTPDNNPLLEWERWFEELPARMERLEHESLISEAKELILRAQSLQGGPARQNEAFLYGRLGELLFHSGRVMEAAEPFESARKLCQEINDFEGQRVYLGNLLETHRYLGNRSEVLKTARKLIELSQSHAFSCENLLKRLELLERGEPLCRVVCVRDGNELELAEISELGEGLYHFDFRRNRLQLQMAITLTQQGKELAAGGNLADALEKFQQATEVDPYDPDPVYQMGVCLLDLGGYSKAREAFEDVDRLAPGWYRCRTDRWLAAGLENGDISVEEFLLLRSLDDGGLPPNKAIPIALKAIEAYPSFAPLYLILGDLQRNNAAEAIELYRKGLDIVAEPDLESRLLCALAGVLPKDSPERDTLVKRAVSIDGSLVAQAAAALIGS
jgi:tetratricopeptide (TPR) repeat protein